MARPYKLQLPLAVKLHSGCSFVEEHSTLEQEDPGLIHNVYIQPLKLSKSDIVLHVHVMLLLSKYRTL